MWYTIAKHEQYNIKAGTIFLARKDYGGFVLLYKLKFGTYNDKMVPIPDTTSHLHIDADEAREWLTTPSKDFDDVVEESIMICEGAYC